MRASIVVTIALLLSTTAVAACQAAGPDHTAERLQCLRGCASQKDACIVSAQSAAQVQQCDGQNQQCVAPCPQ